jgi:hypothetical protein
MAYDSKCLSTAEYFLGSKRLAEDEQSLAQSIQDAVENWFAEQERRNEPCLSPAEQQAQAGRCGCMGADDYCGCQNVPDATTRAARAEQKASA